jgi:membrane protein YqaA with SNARE-associated domain
MTPQIRRNALIAIGLVTAVIAFFVYWEFEQVSAILGEYGDWILGQIELYMTAYGYWVVFFGVMMENAGLPVPGETILLVAGYFASKGHFNIFLVMLIACCGAVLGDNAGFAIGHHYGRGILLKFGKYVFLTPERLEHLENYFKSHGNKTILVARFITWPARFCRGACRCIANALAYFLHLQRFRRNTVVDSDHDSWLSLWAKPSAIDQVGRTQRHDIVDRRGRCSRDRLANIPTASRRLSFFSARSTQN